jgi:hypothetical protein
MSPVNSWLQQPLFLPEHNTPSVTAIMSFIGLDFAQKGLALYTVSPPYPAP